jgi:hypothetical protein
METSAYGEFGRLGLSRNKVAVGEASGVDHLLSKG